MEVLLGNGAQTAFIGAVTDMRWRAESPHALPSPV
jgi:hypothetical protein